MKTLQGALLFGMVVAYAGLAIWSDPHSGPDSGVGTFVGLLLIGMIGFGALLMLGSYVKRRLTK